LRIHFSLTCKNEKAFVGFKLSLTFCDDWIAKLSIVCNTPGAVRNREASVNDVDLIVGCSDVCLMHFVEVETMAVGNLLSPRLESVAVLSAPFFRTVNSSSGASSIGVEVGFYQQRHKS
jgi:hypothetical protein